MRLMQRLVDAPRDPAVRLSWMKRQEAWRADRKANELRLAALVVFAINELTNYYVLHVVDCGFHLRSLVLAALWFSAACIYEGILVRRRTARGGSYVMTAIDLVLLTSILVLADGPRSPLVAIYFLIIALSAMGFDPYLPVFSGVSSTTCYLIALKMTKLRQPDLLVPPYQAVLVMLCLLIMGITMARLAARVLTLLNDEIRAGGDAR